MHLLGGADLSYSSSLRSSNEHVACRASFTLPCFGQLPAETLLAGMYLHVKIDIPEIRSAPISQILFV